MSVSGIAQRHDQSHQNAIQGHCSRCHRIWTLTERQGVCRWCGKPAICQTTIKPSRKTSSRRVQRQAPAYNNGYDQLQDNWLTYYKVASHYSHKALAQDREDLLHDIIVAIADVARSKPLTEPAMYRIASVTVVHYWRAYYKLTNGIDCGSCSKTQRQKCKENNLYTECPKAIKLEYFSKPVTDSEGNMTELGELIADDKALDLDQWLDAKKIRLHFPQRLINIAHKRRGGITLDHKDREYLRRFRQGGQKKLL